MLCLIQLTEGKDSLERVLSQAHVDVHLKEHIFTKLITQVVNIHLAPVLLDVVSSLSEAGIQGNIGKVLRNILEKKISKIYSGHLHPSRSFWSD